MSPSQFQTYGQNNVFLLLPVGAHDQQDDHVITLVDDDAIQSVIAAFNPGDELLVDACHGSLDPNGSSEAYGWITALFGDERGVWGRVFWTDLGMDAILGGRFRFLSPYCETMDLGDNVVQPVKVESCTLTNIPGLEMSPIIDLTTEEEGAVANRRTLISNRGTDNEAQMMIDKGWHDTAYGPFNDWIALTSLLGLPETSDQETVKAKLNAFHAPRVAKRSHTPEQERIIAERKAAVRNRDAAVAMAKFILPNNTFLTMRNRTIAHMIKDRMIGKGSSIRGYSDNEQAGTSPVKYTREATVQSNCGPGKPRARLNWNRWSGGLPTFTNNDTEDASKLNALADKLCKNKSVRQIRSLANQYNDSYFMRSALSKRADHLDQAQRAKRSRFGRVLMQ